MRLSAGEVQNILGVKDRQVIAHGYTFERKTVEIYFEFGQLVRRVNGVNEWSSTMFEPTMFEQNMKRFYKNGVQSYLATMFETYGNGLPLTEGGREWGYLVDWD